MTALRPRIPRELYEAMERISRDAARHVERLDRRIPARDDLAGGATLAQTITAINALYADLRDNGLMERS